MKQNISITVLILLLIIIGSILIKKQQEVSPSSSLSHKKSTYYRIISMAPSITETVFALGLGEQVVGVTRFCTFPSEAQQKEKVGGYFDTNYEVLASLQPDLVIVLPEHEKAITYLNELELPYLLVHNRKVSEIIDTILTIGNECSAEKEAEKLVNDITSRIHAVEKKTEGLPCPRVLISVGRTVGTGTLQDVYIAGRNTYYDELIAYAGGRNAFESNYIEYPVLSAEGLLHINPEIIIDMIPDLDIKESNKTMLTKEWDCIAKVDAVKNDRVYLVSEDYYVVPGPRFILLLEDLVRIIHPEI